MNDVRSALEQYLSIFKDTVNKNLEFLIHNCKNLIDSCFDLQNDVISVIFWVRPADEKASSSMPTTKRNLSR